MGVRTICCERTRILLLLCLTVFAMRPLGAEEPARKAFDLGEVEEIARNIAAHPYVNAGPETAANAFLASLTKEQWDKISFRLSEALWGEERLPFAVTFHHPGFIYSRDALYNIVENGTAKPLAFSAVLFDYPTAELREQAAKAAPGFAGFALRNRFDMDNGSDESGNMDEIASFLGASYFQSRGRASRYGIYARALALDTALPDGEIFPQFREFWLEKPQPDADSFTVYALLDSPYVTGAYRLVITPGSTTVMDVTARLFPRQAGKKPGKIGIAPLTSMYLYSETGNGRPSDFRPEIHNSDGLLYADAEEQWTWIPLNNPARLTVNRFPLENPRGFGLMQRDDNFDHYQDLDARYDRRPSLWVEPKGEWGAGHVELVEIPGTEDYHGNIVAFWVPAATVEESAGTDENPGYSFNYRLYWQPPAVTPHRLGRVTATRIHKLQDNLVQFLVDFEGEKLNAFPADTGLASVVETPEQLPVIEKKLVKNEATSGWRLMFKVRAPAKEGLLGSLFAGREGNGSIRLKALLKQGENLPDPLTETWLYDVQPIQ